jgi:dipeptidyl aminopeptidase/acylaminoacyl peptidase|tara:strand:- start:853 stop:2766 length:1914 start_codon:yes stop_codon:yes gene_type:complete
MRIMPIVLLMVLAAPSYSAKPTPRDLLNRTEYLDVMISPTGEYVAISKIQGDEAWFSIVDLEKRETTYNSNMGKRIQVAQMLWVSDDHMIHSPARKMWSDVKGRTGELMSFDARKNRIKRLHAKDCPRCGGVLIHTLPDDPKHVIVAGSFDQYSEAHLVNIKTGLFRRIARGAAPYGSFVANRDGKVVFSTGTNVRNEREIYIKGKYEWELIESHGIRDEGWFPFAEGPKANTFFTWDTRNGGTRGLGVYDTKTKEHKSLYRFGEIDLSGVFRDYNYQIFAVRTDLHYPAIHYLNKSHPLAKIQSGLQKQFPNDTITFTSTTRDYTKVIALVHSDRNPGQFLLVDLNAKKVELLFQRKPQLKGADLAPMSPVEVKVRDGSTVYGYVTSAPDTPKPGPMVVLIHGGPHGARDLWGYNREVQLIAGLGVHVLQVNFRGSGGYGLNYEQKGYGEWGRLMQDDVTDATRWAIESKIADPRRICIYGASYGAYSALMGAAREPDLYTCAVGFAGVYDMTLMASVGDIPDRKAGIAFVREVLGTDEETLKSISPVYLADKIKADVMLVHGSQDRRAPIRHAKLMRSALEDAGKKVTWLSDSLQGHGFLGLKAQVNLYQEVAEFMGPHLGVSLENISWVDAEPD